MSGLMQHLGLAMTLMCDSRLKNGLSTVRIQVKCRLKYASSLVGTLWLAPTADNRACGQVSQPAVQ
jgi:hypothetical protein